MPISDQLIAAFLLLLCQVMTGCSGSRPQGAVNLATTEPLQRERLGDRGQMVAMVFEPNIKACNASFMVKMSLLLAANTLTLLLSKDITSHTNRGGDMCGEKKKKKMLLRLLLCAALQILESTILLFFWLIWPVSSDVVLLPWSPSATVCTVVLSARSSSHRH